MQHEAETKECTFRPNIIAAAGTGAAEDDRAGGPGSGPGGPRPPLHERLHKEAREREAARALAQHHLEAELLRECTFQVMVLVVVQTYRIITFFFFLLCVL